MKEEELYLFNILLLKNFQRKTYKLSPGLILTSLQLFDLFSSYCVHLSLLILCLNFNLKCKEHWDRHGNTFNPYSAGTESDQSLPLI